MEEKLPTIEDRLASLTKKERLVLDEIVGGAKSKEIAAKLGICAKTLDIHRCAVLRKMQARTPVDLARLVNLIAQRKVDESFRNTVAVCSALLYATGKVATVLQAVGLAEEILDATQRE